MPNTNTAGVRDVSRGKFCLATILCTLISLTFALSIIHFTPITDMLVSHTNHVLTKPFAELNYYEQIVAQRLLESKSLITVDSLWSMQVAFFQTIVSVLIGLNAAILAVAFFIIRASSKAEAINETSTRFEEYTSSSSFSKLVKRKAKKELDNINATFDDNFDKTDTLRKEVENLKTDLSVISSRLAKLDNSEESDTDGTLIAE